ncbi:MAG: transglycosylase domain-containing protein [Velocimicrobium sp.]
MNYSKKGTAKRQKQLKSNKHRMLTKAGVSFFRAFIICFVVMCIVGIFAGVGVLKGIIDNAPSIDSIDVAPSGFVTTLYYSNGAESQQLVGSAANRVYVTLDKIPDVVYNSFIAIEDKRFWEHNGIDVKGIMRAFGEVIAKRELDSGASTLTQQLLKNQVFNGGSETAIGDKIQRKIQEQYLAVKLEQKLAEGSDKQHAKELILEYYLNTINLGQNTLGVQAASERYFNKDISDLTLSEATVIAGITQNPSGLNPLTHPEDNAAKREIILDYMEEQGYITSLEKEDALADDVYSRIQLVNDEQYSDSSSTVNSYFDDALIDDVIEDFQTELGYSEAQAVNMLYRGGLQIYTTQSKKLQKVCDKVFSDESLYPANSKLALTYRLSVIDKHGDEHNYSETTLANYFIYEKGNNHFNLYFNKKEDAEPYIEEYRNFVLKDSDEITGEVINYTLEPQVSFVLMNQSNGKVLAMIGGRGKKTASRTLNRATDSPRQPGSTFKVVSTYLPALDTKGMTLASVEDDSEYYYPGTKKQVKNWNGENYKGLTPLRDGIVNSMNVVTVKTMVDVTPQVAYDYLLKLGFTTVYDNYVGDDGKIYSDIGYPTALGGLTKGVTNFELTASFAAIANKGVYTEPTLYTKVVDHDGNILIDKEPKTRQVMKESTAWLLTSAMEDVVKIGTGTRARFDTNKISMPLAGKTGTTSNNVDTWFVGFTPYYTAGIWSGFDDGNTSQTETSYHKTLWKTVMENIHIKAKKEYKEFEKPSSIVTAKICTKSGKLAVDGLCNATSRVEYFDVNTVPKEKCDVHVKYRICKESGELAGEYCPEDQVEEKIFLIKDETGHTADSANAISADQYTKTCHIHTAPQVKDPEPSVSPIDTPPSVSASPQPSSTPEEATAEPTNPTTDPTLPAMDDN